MEMKKKADSWFDLPKDILRQTMEKLCWSERLPLCLVCKSWHECFLETKNTREVLPWTMCFNRDKKDEGGICRLGDPSARRSYIVKDAAIVKNKHLSGAVPCDSRYSWVLFSKRIYGSPMVKFFFYNPFINEVIQLPNLETFYDKVAFSLSPTSPDCVVIAFTIREPIRVLSISICHPGDQSWRTFKFLCDVVDIQDLVYAGDSFYCILEDVPLLSDKLYLGRFNVKQQQWQRLSLPPLLLPPLSLSLVVPFDGDLILYNNCYVSTPKRTSFWRLKLPEEKWVVLERESLMKYATFTCCNCQPFSVPPIENARQFAGSKICLSDYICKIKNCLMRTTFIQPPLVKNFKCVSATTKL